jgi:hypothetical protein
MDDLDLGQTVRGFSAGQKILNRYTFVRILGRGGMGVVWLAYDDDLEREVALKFLPELVVHDRAMLEDLKRETRRSLALTHHNIVRIHDFAQGEECACISMEYVDGTTLSSMRVDQPDNVFEVEALGPLMQQVCDALDYAHTRARIVHRDLKPSNLMVNAKGEVKVADFGIARSLTDSVSMLTGSSGTSGTLVYMSPQQLDGERFSELDDIYSLGATIYELLTGKPPFYSGQIDRLVREKVPPAMAARRADLASTSKAVIPRHWEEAVASCLAKDPGARPQSATELYSRLSSGSDVQTGYPTPAPIPVSAAPIQPHATRRRVIFAVAALVLFVLAAGGAAFWYGNRKPAPPAATQDATAAARSAESPAVPVVGSLMIKTEPPGANVSLSGVTKSSPALFTDLPRGTVSFQVAMDGYESITSASEVVPGHIKEVGPFILARSTPIPPSITAEAAATKNSVAGDSDYEPGIPDLQSQEGTAPRWRELVKPDQLLALQSARKWIATVHARLTPDKLKPSSGFAGQVEIDTVKQLLRSASLPIEEKELLAVSRCRAIAVSGLGMIIYSFHPCRFTNKDGGLFFERLGGSYVIRRKGPLYRHDERTFVFVGTRALYVEGGQQQGPIEESVGILLKKSKDQFLLINDPRPEGYELYEIRK